MASRRAPNWWTGRATWRSAWVFAGMAFLNLVGAAGHEFGRAAGAGGHVTALHACDTATDDAIAFGLAKQARHMVLVPCCRPRCRGWLRKNKALSLSKNPLAELWRHPLHTREFGSQITNVLRCLQLEANGYQVTVTELVVGTLDEKRTHHRQPPRHTQRSQDAAGAAAAGSAE